MGALAIIEVQERDGHYRQRHEVQHWPLRIGRALDNDIVLDDPHVAARHVELDEENGQVRFTVGATRNGIHIDGHEFTAGGSGFWSGRHELHLGRTVLKLRTAHDPLTDEALLFSSRPAAGLTASLLLGLLYYFLLGLDSWLDFGGETALWRVLAPLFIGFTFILAFWVLGWSLVSKLFTKQLQTGSHLRVVLLGLVVLFVADQLVRGLAFAFNWPSLDTHATLVLFGGIGAIVLAHLRVITNRRLPQLAATVALLSLAGIAAYQLAQYGRTGHASDKHYMATLYPPGLRLSNGVSTDAFITQAGALKGRLDMQARDPAEEGREYPE